MPEENENAPLSIMVHYKRKRRLSALLDFLKQNEMTWHVEAVSTLEELGTLAEKKVPDCMVIEVADGDMAETIAVLGRHWDLCSLVPILLITAFELRQRLREEIDKARLSDVMVMADEAPEMVAAVKVIARVRRAEEALRAVNRRLSEVVEDRSRALHESEERYRFLMNACSDAVMVFEVDKYGGNGNLLDMNDVTCKWTGYNREEMSRMTLRRLSSPDRLSNVPGRLESILQHQELFFETVIQTRDGLKLPVEVMTRSFALDEHRNMVVAIGRRPDKQGGAHRHGDHEENFRFLATQTGQIIYDCNLNTERVIWGGAVVATTGFPPRQLTRMGWKGWQERILREDWSRVKTRLAEAMECVGKYQLEYRILQKNGELRHIEDHGVVLPDSTGKAYRLLGTIKDITARVQAEEQRRRLETELQHSQRLESLGVLAGGIAHDFNNILAGIIGLTDLALREVPSDSLAHDDLTEALQAANRAKELVRQILAFSRQSGQDRTPVYLHIIAREVIKLLRASLPATIEIIDSADINSGVVLANASQMYQVITNFSTNAAQAMAGQPGKLEICVRNVDMGMDRVQRYPGLRLGPYVMLSVSDNGHGMAPSVLARAFDPFFTTKGPGQGTGMGLAVAHGIITDHGGVVYAESKLGVGSTFYVYLPRIAGVVVEESEYVESLPRGHERILFVDDDEAVLRFAEAALPRIGFDVTLCTSGEEALSVYLKHPGKFDLVITDQIMPKMSGEELATRIHAHNPSMPILLFTGFSDEVSKERLQASGIREVVFKPIIVRDLVDGIRRVLDAEPPQSPSGA